MPEKFNYVNEDVIEETEMQVKSSDDVPDVKMYTYEEAFELTGNGLYNIGLLLACFVIITAMGIDIFGLGIIVTASVCDLKLSIKEIGILSSMPFAGIIVMSYPWGYLADTRGRRRVLMWAMVGSFFSASLSSLAPDWRIVAALRFIGSAMSSAAESATYALLGECCGERVRARYLLLMTSALMLTPTLYYIWAYFILRFDFAYDIHFLGIVYRPWRLLTLVMALPLGLGALMLFFFSESPKFLANVGRERESIEVLRRMYAVNGRGKAEDYPVMRMRLEEKTLEASTESFWSSLWTQVAPLFAPPLLRRSLQLYYLTFVVYIANNSFAIVLPYIFNVFFTSYAGSGAGAAFCDLFANNYTEFNNDGNVNTTENQCNDKIVDNTIWAGCVHGLSFFLLNALIAQCAGRRKVMTLTILLVAAAAAVALDRTGEPISGLVLFLVFMTTAMVFGVISSYFVDLYPTSYRGMVACIGMMVARLSAFAGTNAVSSSIATHCRATFHITAVLIVSAMELLGSSLLHSMQRGEPLESTNPKLIYDPSYFLFFVFETVELDVVASSSGSVIAVFTARTAFEHLASLEDVATRLTPLS
ncbi:Synaptic vesicle glycoprotein 2B [Eumeta japonica]|uniref:Synaptic vesicle glycoprotein 2B n=1 Tax=Eumeta variegata TaxID=151549 RepID=A0A4C1X7T0_EUMVA|nr:Synaptic vesicle glycoprotein 2B [Eumeta japonica]